MAQAPAKLPQTVQVIVTRAFRYPYSDMVDGVAVRAADLKIAEIDEVVTLDRETARDVLGANKATPVSLDADQAKAQIDAAKLRRRRAAADAVTAAAAAEKAANSDPIADLEAKLPGLIAAAVAQTLVQMGVVAKPTAGN